MKGGPSQPLQEEASNYPPLLLPKAGPSSGLSAKSLVRWAGRKYKKLRGHRTQAWKWLVRLIDRQPTLLALWARQRGEVFTMGAV
jgi:hypothetical protein